VVVTVGTAAACSSPIRTNNPPGPDPQPTVQGPTMNPPEPNPEPTTVQTATPPDAEPPVSELGSRGTLQVNAVGCMWVARFENPKCPPNARCNPPRPRFETVTCPSWAQGTPPPAEVERRPDGSCFAPVRREKACAAPDDCQPATLFAADVACPGEPGAP
jgi:hypothetical protein